MSTVRLDTIKVAADALPSSAVAAPRGASGFAELLQGQLNASDLLRAAGQALDAVRSTRGTGSVEIITSEKAVAPDIGQALQALKEWSGTGRTRRTRAQGADDPLGYAAHDASLAGRYDVVARRREADEPRVSRRV
jgi:hypothetical protein